MLASPRLAETSAQTRQSPLEVAPLDGVAGEGDGSAERVGGLVVTSGPPERLGSGGVDFPAFFRILRERNYDGWVTLDFDAPRSGEGTVEQDMNSHRKYLLETLHASLRS